MTVVDRSPRENGNALQNGTFMETAGIEPARHSRRDRTQPQGPQICHYCGTADATRWESDHFPMPAEFGGTEVVWACLNCHDLKDRVSLMEWPATVTAEALRQAAEACEGQPRVRLLLAKCLTVVLRAEARERGAA